MDESGDMDVLAASAVLLAAQNTSWGPFNKNWAVLFSVRRPYVQRVCLSCDIALLCLLMIRLLTTSAGLLAGGVTLLYGLLLSFRCCYLLAASPSCIHWYTAFLLAARR
jgi:hypothetical protein